MPTMPPPVTATPISVLMSPVLQPTAAPAVNLTRLIDIDSISIDETGNHGAASMSFNWRDGHVATGDVALAYAQLRGPNRVTCADSTGALLFRGYLKAPKTTIEGGNDARKDVEVRDVSSRLDTLLVLTTQKRSNGETVKARLQWLYNAWGVPLISEGLNFAKVATTNNFAAALDDQTFQKGITVREATEQILGNASDSFQYFLDYSMQLWAWDLDSPRSFPAPFDIVDTVPGVGECNAEIGSFEFNWDLDSLWTFYVVQAKKTAFDLTLGDNDQIPSALWGTAVDIYPNHGVLPGPAGVDVWGLYQRTIQAPDADTQKKSLRVLRAALRDTRNPIPRGTFSLSGTQAVGWHGGQQVYVKSAVHGLNGHGADGGPYAGTTALQPFGIAHLVREFEAGGTKQHVTIDFGYRRPNLYTG